MTLVGKYVNILQLSTITLNRNNHYSNTLFSFVSCFYENIMKSICYIR